MESTAKENKRRKVLKSLVAAPFVGALTYGMWRKLEQKEAPKTFNMAKELDLHLYDRPAPLSRPDGKRLRLGIIGYGIRGKQLLQAAGFAHPDELKRWRVAGEKNEHDKRYQDFIEQEDLNVEVRGVCDLFDVFAEEAQITAANVERSDQSAEITTPVKRYRLYKELLAAPDIDAVIIATPDHWHAQMGIDAARAGKHIYIEKGFTRTVEETYAIRQAIKESGVIMQCGHQGRQTDSFHKAKEIIDKNVLGQISLIEVCTNRNDPNGAWVYPIHPEASEKTIDWEQFVACTEKQPFSAERFFRWRCWWDYGTGLGGDLLTHEFDAINQVMNLGIPHSAVASGGVYFFKDGREVPDTYQAIFEYPDRDLTLMYSASLANDNYRGKTFMGHDATMKLDNSVKVFPDRRSTQYQSYLREGKINPDTPMISYEPGKNQLDAYTSATQQYFASRGLLYTQKDSKRVNTTHLHIKEWLECIRAEKTPSCGIDQAFEEAMTSHMATKAYRENRKVYWDADKEQVV